MPVMNSSRSLLFFLALASLGNSASASGWSDYELPIDPGYKIVRCNSLDVCLGHDDGLLIYVPDNYENTGPIVGYSVTHSHILLHTLGRTPRKLFEGDTFENVDPSQEYYFVFCKSNDQLDGPYSLTEFNSHAVVREIGELEWTQPANPNVVLPLAGGLLFLAISAAIFGIPILLVVGIIGTIVLLVLGRRASKKDDKTICVSGR
jgi:hypothetical protein